MCDEYASNSPEKNAHVPCRSEYVVVSDSTGEATELPTHEDNSLFMTTLQAAIPGATGLKFKNPKTGASRAVMVDPTGAKLLPPTDGWDDKVFNAIVPQTHVRNADVSVKRRKVERTGGGSDSDSDGETGGGRLGRKRALDARVEPLVRRTVDLIVLGINFKTSDEALKEYFETFGHVVYAEIKKTPDGSSKGFGFIRFENIEDQDKVMAQPVHMVEGRRCECKIPDQRGVQQYDTFNSGHHHSRKVTVNKIFVGRLTDKHTDEALRNFFQTEAQQILDTCKVTDVFIPRPFRGFAFVTFSSAEVAERLAKLSQFVIEGVSVVTSLAVPREDRDANAMYFNDYGYGYGYGKGGAGYVGAPGANGKDMYAGYMAGMQQQTGYHRGGWPLQSAGMMGGDYGGSNWMQPTPSNRSGGHVAGGHGAGGHGAAPSGPPPPGGPPGQWQHAAAPNQIANGLDALNLNQKNPELLNAAWSAFFSTLNNQPQASGYTQ